VFNIDKFNKENANMRQVTEVLGDSFFKMLSELDDLVLIMDESHHYRAAKGAKALNELNPLLGLELTATPLVSSGSKQIPFKNVVYEYPLSQAIADGYTRTPYAVTRADVAFYNFGEEQLDKLMLNDGIQCHEYTKRKLEIYADKLGVKKVKPFMLVVCQNTDHAAWVENYVKSQEFCDGRYENKTITIHSKLKGSESDFNTKMLLDVERADNPVEIVIHVNMLKEGWDVNNLYTIVPLRTAASKIMREQMVGRGLRLPYGERTHDKDVDAVMLTAHDKFNDILEEAQKGDSIFKAGNVIKVEELPKEEIVYTQVALDLRQDAEVEEAYEQTGAQRDEKTTELFEKATSAIVKEVVREIETNAEHKIKQPQQKKIVDKVVEQIKQNADLGEVYKRNENPFYEWIEKKTEKAHKEVVEKYIPIPKIKVTDEGVEEYNFLDFDMDFSDFKFVPIKNDLLIQSLENLGDREWIKGNAINFEGYNPHKVLLELLRGKSEIDYEKCSELLYKLIDQTCSYFENAYGDDGMKNIVMMYRKDVAQKIYDQMMQHFYITNGFLKEEVIGTRNYNFSQSYTAEKRLNLFATYVGNIRSIVFDGIQRGVFREAQFDSNPELKLARVLERDRQCVKNWLRPASNEFNITYNHGHNYEPDFVVELDDRICLVEVKGEDRLEAADVLAKKDRALRYCKVVSEWGRANGYKEWDYVFIPSKQIAENSTFETLVERFTVDEDTDLLEDGD
jgi:type III restriction enzyme